MGPVKKKRGPVEFLGARKYGLGARDKKIWGPVEFLGARKYALGAWEKIEIPLCPFSTLTTVNTVVLQESNEANFGAFRVITISWREIDLISGIPGGLATIATIDSR